MTYHGDMVEAQARFLDLINAAAQGEAIVITKNDQPLVQIVPVGQPVNGPQFGSARGLIAMTDDFDAPLDDFRDYMP